MNEVDRSRNFGAYDLGITIAFLFGVSSAKCITLWMKLFATIYY